MQRRESGRQRVRCLSDTHREVLRRALEQECRPSWWENPRGAEGGMSAGGASGEVTWGQKRRMRVTQGRRRLCEGPEAAGLVRVKCLVRVGPAGRPRGPRIPLGVLGASFARGGCPLVASCAGSVALSTVYRPVKRPGTVWTVAAFLR